MSSLVELPSELIDTIATSLPSSDLLNLRLTCAELDAKSFHQFTEGYFRAKQFMYSRYALDALVEISKSRLGRYVRAVSLGPEFSQTDLTDRGHMGEARNRILEWLKEYGNDNRHMERTGLDNLMLHEAFQNLPNCEGIEFRDYSLADYGTDSFGEASFNRNVGQDIVNLREPYPFRSLSRAFTLTLEAVQAARLRIKWVIVQVADTYELCRPVLELPRPPKELVTFAFSHLRVFKVSIDNGYAQTAEGDSLRRYTDFLACTPQLRLLSLSFFSCYDTAEIFNRLVSASKKLTELEVISMYVSEDELLEPILRLAPTLRSLRISGVILHTGTWQSVYGRLRDDMRLTKIEIECVEDVNPISYLGTDKVARYSGQTEICYDGPNMKHFLNSLTNCIASTDGNGGSLTGIDPHYFVV